jgi:hypothetical protein
MNAQHTSKGGNAMHRIVSANKTITAAIAVVTLLLVGAAAFVAVTAAGASGGGGSDDGSRDGGGGSGQPVTVVEKTVIVKEEARDAGQGSEGGDTRVLPRVPLRTTKVPTRVTTRATIGTMTVVKTEATKV